MLAHLFQIFPLIALVPLVPFDVPRETGMSMTRKQVTDSMASIIVSTAFFHDMMKKDPKADPDARNMIGTQLDILREAHKHLSRYDEMMAQLVLARVDLEVERASNRRLKGVIEEGVRVMGNDPTRPEWRPGPGFNEWRNKLMKEA